MKPEVLSMIKLALASDDTLTAVEREAILACCRNPVSGQSSGNGVARFDFLPPKEVAERMHVNIRTIKRYLRAGMLDSVKIRGLRRIRTSDLQSFVDNGAKGNDSAGRDTPRAVHMSKAS